MLKPFSENIWISSYPVSFGLFEIASQMTVIRLNDGSLWIHSPGPIDDDLKREILDLGTPAFIVCPNRFHHLHALEFQQAFPDAKMFAAEGLAEKRKDLRVDVALSPDAGGHWPDEFDSVFVAGLPMLNEVVFFHKATGTLIVTDILFLLEDQGKLGRKLMFSLLGLNSGPAMSRSLRLWIKDKNAFRSSIGAIAKLGFDKMLLTHENNIESDAKALFVKAFSWLG